MDLFIYLRHFEKDVPLVENFITSRQDAGGCVIFRVGRADSSESGKSHFLRFYGPN